MAVSDDYLQFVMDQLEGFGSVRVQKAFAQAIIFCDDIPFGYVIDDVLYFKVDESNKSDYEKAGVTVWVASDKKNLRRSYEVPADVLEDRKMLQLWAGKAIKVARCRITTEKKGNNPNHAIHSDGNSATLHSRR